MILYSYHGSYMIVVLVYDGTELLQTLISKLRTGHATCGMTHGDDWVAVRKALQHVPAGDSEKMMCLESLF